MAVVVEAVALASTLLLVAAALMRSESIGPGRGPRIWTVLGRPVLLVTAGCTALAVGLSVPWLLIPQTVLYLAFALHLARRVAAGSADDCRCTSIATRPGPAGIARALVGSAATAMLALTPPLARASGPELATLVVVALSSAALMYVVPSAVDGPPVIPGGAR